MNQRNLFETKQKTERAFLVGVEIKGENMLMSVDDSLDELKLLSLTAGLEVIGRESQSIDHINPSTYIGKGKTKEIKLLAESLHADIVIFDVELSPRNFRDLEKEFGNQIRVIDRTTLILDIFGQHAQTSEGKLQVELAQYEYLLPRLTRAWSHLARQAGGGGGRTGNVGGVGLRGPGETQLEVDKRRIRSKISKLKDDLEKVRQHRNRYRKNRQSSNIPIVAMVGYTNAGKSTLHNLLTDSDVLIADKLFATLDPTTRRLEFRSGNAILLTDTVGFIQKLPTHLVAAFRATLEEVSEADLLLHIVDISHQNAISHYQSVIDTLKEIGAGNIPVITVLNKIDKFPDLDQKFGDYPPFKKAAPISALKKIGMNDLLNKIDTALFSEYSSIAVEIPYKNGQLISLFHRYGQILKVEHGIGSVTIEGKIPGRLVADFNRFLLNKH
jgi:GTP-binding protein HflX